MKRIDLPYLAAKGRESYINGLSEDGKRASNHLQDFLDRGRFPRSKAPVELQQIYNGNEIRNAIPKKIMKSFHKKRQFFLERKLAELNSGHPYWLWVS